MQRDRIPSSTYRLQLNLQCRFVDATDLVPYLHDLGITDLYVSPNFKARRGSTHGYDLADPYRVNSELGTEEEAQELTRKLEQYGMGLLLDIVPNHMAASWENPWWRDVLENGPSSQFAKYFDIDWHPATTKAAFLQENRVLLPILGDLYGNVLEDQQFTLKLDDNGFFLRYYEHRLPIEPHSYSRILRVACERAREQREPNDVSPELEELTSDFEQLPSYASLDERDIRTRREGVPHLKRKLWNLYQSSATGKQALDRALLEIGGTREAPESFQQLDELLNVQPYRLAHWKIGMEEINYRRFFDINELVGVRVQDREVFDRRHALILQAAARGGFAGLRVDHIDGLWDPQAYLEMLQYAICPQKEGEPPRRCFLLVEKILGEGESLPAEWPVAGTTGYDYLNAVNALFVEPGGLAALEKVYSSFTGATLPFSEVCYEGNKKVMETLFAGEVQALSHHLARLAAQNRRARDLPMQELVQLLIEVTACLPVYRTYVRDTKISERDRALMERTLQIARRRTPPGRVSDAALAYLHRVLLIDPPFYGPQQDKDFLEFVMRWQQFTGPVMAKGVEDTACYVHCSLLSLNEVGADVLRDQLPLDAEAFHQFNRQRRDAWPDTMNTTTTHDTKRSEDVRARINVLSELHSDWEQCLARWSRWNARHRRAVQGHMAPAPHEETLIYQTMLGAWPLDAAEAPFFRERLLAYLQKAGREAKVHTSWIAQNDAHENALREFASAILDRSAPNRFLADFERFQKLIAFYGAINSLAQVLCKITSPGFPDFYQGQELWDFSLVDPDSRRPVDFTVRARMLDELRHRETRGNGLPVELLANWRDGRVKLFTTWKALSFRRDHSQVFASGRYVPIRIAGARRENVCAFARGSEEGWALTIVPRFCSQLAEPEQWPLGAQAWRNTTIELPADFPKKWRNILTGETLELPPRSRGLRLSAILQSLPVAALTNL